MYAKIVSPGFSYRLTDDDVLWAGRMVDGEGDSDAALVLWSMTQRFGGLVRRGSFARFIRAYSQPINPIWLRNGVCCAPGATGCPARPSRSFYGEDPCSESRLVRRERMASLPWPQLPAGVRRDVLRWANAKMSNPVPRAVDFAAPFLVQRKMARPGNELELIKRGRNWFLAKGVSRGWDRNHVVMELDGRVVGAGSTGLGAVGVLGFAGLVAGAAWVGRQAARRRQGLDG